MPAPQYGPDNMTVTPNYSFNLPTVNADSDTWGTKLDANWTSLDTTLKTVSDAATAAGTTAGAAMAKSANGSDIGNAGTFRTNLGVAIGSDVQAYDATLASLAALTGTSQKIIYFSGSNTAAELTVSTGLTLTGGNLTANVQSVAGRTGAVTLAYTDVSGVGTNAAGARTVSTSSPSGTPADGDIWVQRAS